MSKTASAQAALSFFRDRDPEIWEDVVMWSDHGRVVHRSPDCPVVVRLICSLSVDHPERFRMWSYREDTLGDGKPMPPDNRPLCRLRACR